MFRGCGRTIGAYKNLKCTKPLNDILLEVPISRDNFEAIFDMMTS